MIYSKIIAGSKYNRVKSRECWIEENATHSKVYSYETYIGYIIWDKKAFITWGYRAYSKTTSKQITQLCKEYKLERIDV